LKGVELKVADIMTQPPVTATPDMSYHDVVDRLLEAGVSGLPVVGATGELVGIVTEADVLSKEAYGGGHHRSLAVISDLLAARDHHWVVKAASKSAGDIMTRGVVTCLDHDEVRSAARKMLREGVKRLPVVDKAGNLIGILSRQDILRVFDRADEDIAADVKTALSAHPDIPRDHHVTFRVEQGVVILSGDVRTAWDKPRIVAVLVDIPGVIDVVARLPYREPTERPASYSS
jgi:CBS domain-containing protein